MVSTKTRPACLISAVLLAICSLAWQACAATDVETSCKTFVQSFYDWYIAKDKANNAGGSGSANSPLETALKTRSDAFSPELCKQLKDDLAASAKSPNEVVGLDFDPILNSQEEVQHYKAEKVTSKGNSFLVEVYGSLNGKKEAAVTVEPELTQRNGKWQFVNFRYKVDKKDDDLLHMLKQLRDERQQHK